MSLTELESALDALEEEGARGFDVEACDCVRTLLVRAEELGGATGERLASRAAEHLASLRDRFHAQRERVKRQLDQARERIGAQPELEQSLVRGDVVTVARRLRRARYRSVPRTSAPAITAHVERPASDAPAAVSRADITRVRRKRALVYEDSVAELVASFALARAGDVVPKDAGPYNALRIASHALDTMRELSPSYLTSQLNRLEELASLLALPDLPPKEPPPAPPKPLSKPNKALPKKKPGALKS